MSAARTRRSAPLPLTPAEQAMVEQYPDLVTLPRRDWPRAAAHLDEATAARRNGTECSWCRAPGSR